MEGNVLHRWSCDISRAFPDFKPRNDESQHLTFWRRVHLMENGDLLAIFEGIGLIKLDKDSNLIWTAVPPVKSIPKFAVPRAICMIARNPIAKIMPERMKA